MKNISVITPVHGALGASQEVYSQLKPGDEWIIVDNNKDPQIKGGNGDRKITLLHEPEPGSYNARRTGILHTSNPYLAFLDSDCRPCPDWLEKGRYHLEKHGTVIGRVVPTSHTGSFWGAYDEATSFPQSRLELHRRFCSGNMFMQKDVYLRIGGFDPQRRSGPDRSLVPRLKKSGSPIIYDGSIWVRTPTKDTYASIAGKGRRMAVSARNQKYTLKPALRKVIPEPHIWEIIASRTKDKRLTFFLIYHYFRFHYLYHYFKGGKEPAR